MRLTTFPPLTVSLTESICVCATGVSASIPRHPSLPSPPPACEVPGRGRSGRRSSTSPVLGRVYPVAVLDTGAADRGAGPSSFIRFEICPISGDAVPGWWWPRSRSSPRWSTTAGRTRRSRCPPTTTCARDTSAWRIRCTASKGASPNRAGTAGCRLCHRPVCTEKRPTLPKTIGGANQKSL